MLVIALLPYVWVSHSSFITHTHTHHQPLGLVALTSFGLSAGVFVLLSRCKKKKKKGRMRFSIGQVLNTTLNAQQITGRVRKSHTYAEISHSVPGSLGTHTFSRLERLY